MEALNTLDDILLFYSCEINICLSSICQNYCILSMQWKYGPHDILC